MKEETAEKKEKILVTIPVMQKYFIIQFLKNSIFTMQLCHRVGKISLEIHRLCLLGLS